MLREEIAHALWKNEAKSGTPKSVSDARTLESFANAGTETRVKWLRMAETVMCVIPSPAAPPTEPWDVPQARRENGVECLAFHRGEWRHVKWSRPRKCWLYENGEAGFISERRCLPKPFAALPSHPDAAS